MIHWIFDVDDTLYQLKYRKPYFDYTDIKHDPYLNFLMSKLPGRRHIFSNSMLIHSNKIIEKKRCRHLFKNCNIYTRDKMGCIKPEKQSYHYVMKKIKPRKKDRIIFFDDQLSNLHMAKKYGWITIRISPFLTRKKYPFVDLSFSNINNALEFFISKKKSL